MEEAAWLKHYVETHTINSMVLGDTFFGIAVTLVDDDARRFASDAEISAAPASPVTLGAIMAEVVAALDLPLPRWADAEPAAHPRAA